jgi:hypothetical protein
VRYVGAALFVLLTLGVAAAASFIHVGKYEGSEYFYE